MKSIYLLGLIAFVCPVYSWSHPVAFQGSTGIMGYHSKEMSDMEFNYSIRYWFAPSVQLLRLAENSSSPDIVLGKLNFLAKRWNGESYQANIYLHGGAGNSNLSGRERAVYHAGITADIEDRKLYFLADSGVIRNSNRTVILLWKLRFGFAPYVADFESLHSWLILEVARSSYGKGEVEFVPTLRFFYKNVLWEIGSSLSGSIHLNYIVHL